MNRPVRTRTEALARIAAREADLRSMGVTSLQLFGSAGRDELTPSSDVDALIEFERPVGAFAFFDVREFLAALLGRNVDLVTRSCGTSRRSEKQPARSRMTSWKPTRRFRGGI